MFSQRGNDLWGRRESYVMLVLMSCTVLREPSGGRRITHRPPALSGCPMIACRDSCSISSRGRIEVASQRPHSTSSGRLVAFSVEWSTGMYARSLSINVHDSQIEDLLQRLRNTRFPACLDAQQWDDGASLAFVRRLTDYWQSRFD